MANALSPSRLSALATNTLTNVLELTRHNQMHSKAPQSLMTKISRNLNQLRTGILTLDPSSTSPELIQELRKQYGRLQNLVDGLGVEVTPLDEPVSPISLVSEGRLIDDGTIDPLSQKPGLPVAHLTRTPQDNSEGPLIPHTVVAMDEEEMLQRDDETLKLANHEVVQLQQRMMDTQDETLSQLSTAIARQRDLSINISSELEVHNRLLEETDEALDQTDSRLRRAGRRLEQVGRRHARENTATCIIIGLVVVLVLLIAILK